MKSFFDKKYRLGTDGGEFVDDKEMEFSGCLIDNHDYYDEGIINMDRLKETNKKASDLIERKVSETIKKGNKPLVVGGSHGVSYNVVKAIKNHFSEDIGLVYFDSHDDCQSHCKIPSSTDRCSWVKKIVEDKLVKPENIIFINGDPIPGDSPCNKIGSKQLNKVIKTVVNPNQKEEYHNEVESFIGNLAKNVKKLYVSYDRDFNKKEGVAIPAYTDQIDNRFELEMIKDKGMDIIGSDIQEYFPPAEISNVGLFGAFPKSRTDLKYNILEMKRYLKKL